MSIDVSEFVIKALNRSGDEANLTTIAEAVTAGRLKAAGLIGVRVGKILGVIALVAPIPVGAVTLHFYLPVVVGTIVLISALLLARRLTRWAGALLILIYIGFAVGGYVLYGATSTT